MKFSQINSIWLCLLLMALHKRTMASNITEKFQIIVTEKPKIGEPSQIQNKTIDKLVEEQTDLIKKIIASHKTTAIEYPIVTKKDPVIKDNYHELKREKEQQSIEDLLKRCRLLYQSLNNTEPVEEQTKASKVATVEAFGPAMKPYFLQKPTPAPIEPLKPSGGITEETAQSAPPNYFIMTHDQSSTTQKPQMQQNMQYNVQSNIKYVQLEPVILQKMVLNNGKMLYYWFRSIPTIPQYVHVQPPPAYNHLPHPEKVEKKDSVVEQAEVKETTSEATPSYEIEYATQKFDHNLYRQQMKFVVPISQAKERNVDDITQNPWRIDPYAYYPKNLQPAMVNVRLPYTPNFHMIKTLTLPENTRQTQSN